LEQVTFWIGFKGELAALSAAFLWAASSVVYRRLGQRIPPLQLNFYKGAIAITLMGITLFMLGDGQESIEFHLVPVVFLIISGVIGIGLGDTAYFSALNHLGARRALLFETLAPPLAAVLALIFLGERLSAGAWCGILLTILGVAWVITERTTTDATINRPQAMLGIIWALLAAVAQASGAVLSRVALSESSVSPLWSSLLRLAAGTLIVLLLLLVRRQYTEKTAPYSQPTWPIRLIGILILTAFSSTYLATWLQQTSLKFAPTGIAQTLSATSPLFILPIAASLGERISLRAILGVLVATAGVGLLFSLR
jgi:drug/metabolite transporter (DMT)-like permease